MHVIAHAVIAVASPAASSAAAATGTSASTNAYVFVNQEIVYVRRMTERKLTLHQTEADAKYDANPIESKNECQRWL